jgi:putative PIN family toxin of toxin-antitoxin system
VEAEHVTLYVCPEILDEVTRTLAQPALRRKYAKLTAETVTAFLADVEEITVITENPPSAFSLPRDPADEPYVNLAVATSAHFVVSRDPDLLDLMKDDHFRTAYPRITALDPVGFLKHVRAEVARELGYE